MDDSRGLIAFILVFAVLAGAAIWIGNTDTITPVVAEAKAEVMVGAFAAEAVKQSLSLLAKLILGGITAGIAAAVFAEARKAYSLWKRNATRGRWAPGPNANYQRETQAPKIRKEDLMFMALLDKYPAGAGLAQRLRARRPVAQSDDGDELDIQL